MTQAARVQLHTGILMSDAELSAYGPVENAADRARTLLFQQASVWDALRERYEALSRVEWKEFDFAGSHIRVQFNPARLRSTTAAVDNTSIRERPCFLCPDRIAAPQRGFILERRFLLLCNPYPIFPEHFTIAHREHTPQRLRASIGDFLSLTSLLGSRYLLLYNGPSCGASAPDHLHFQAGSRGFLPVERDFKSLRAGLAAIVEERKGLLAMAVDGPLRPYLVFESPVHEILESALRAYLDVAAEIRPDPLEPMVNVLSSYDENRWRVWIFPRAKHRPARYGMQGDRRLIVSPAAADCGGVLILPREEDFRRLEREDVLEVFNEVSLSGTSFELLRGRLKIALHTMKAP